MQDPDPRRIVSQATLPGAPATASSGTSGAPSPNRSKSAVVTGVCLSMVLLLGGGALAAGYRVAAGRAALEQTKIAPGVRIATVSVGGLTPDAAREKVKDWARAQSSLPVTFTAPVSHKAWNLTLATVGGRFDVDPAVDAAFKIGKDEGTWDLLLHGSKPHDVQIAPEFHLNEKALDKQLATIARAIHRAPRSARASFTPGSGGGLQITQPEQPGVTLDADATKQALLRGSAEHLRSGGSATLVIKEERPKITSADLGEVKTLLGSFHTSYGSSSDNRRHNIELAASHMDGTLLAPGAVFSYNEIVGPREPRLGWRDAPTYQDGQVVPGPGGGVCQTSTTLYNAVLRAGLKIVQRSHHSMPVHYVNPGCDATVAYDDIDFKFQNTTDGPLLVLAQTKGGILTFNLYGKTPEKNFKVDVVSGDEHGNANGGFTVSTYRVFHWDDGTTTRETLSTDTYQPFNGGGGARGVTTKRRKPTATASAAHPKSAPTVRTSEPAAAPAEAPAASGASSV